MAGTSGVALKPVSVYSLQGDFGVLVKATLKNKVLSYISLRSQDWKFSCFFYFFFTSPAMSIYRYSSKRTRFLA